MSNNNTSLYSATTRLWRNILLKLEELTPVEWKNFGPLPVPEDLALMLVDFEYINNGNRTVTLTAWKGTLNGEPSTELVIPNDSRIIL